jgi:CRP-like cAMP-binding protein
MVQAKQQLVDFLKEHSIFKVLDERVLSALSQLFQEQSIPANEVIFRQGETADAIYIVKEGRVEVLQNDSPDPIAILRTGECFGEMAAFNEKRRTASVRAPEKATVLKLPMQSFDELQVYFPEVRTELIRLMDQRMASQAPKQQQTTGTPGLQGNLALFDLPTVIQTIVGPRQVGTLSLRSRVGRLTARISVRNGKIMQCTFAHLSGEHALYELLSHNVPMDFVFEQLPEDAVLAMDKSMASKEPYHLLIEAARRADELPKMMMNLSWPAAIYKQAVAQPEWSTLSEENQIIGRKIWFMLEVGVTVQQLTEKLPFDRYAVLSCIAEMLSKGYIRTRQASPKPQENSQVINFIEESVGAVNGLVSNLCAILGSNKTNLILKQALQEASDHHPQISGLVVDPETLKIEYKSHEKSEAAVKALEQLALTIIALTAKSHPPDQPTPE